MDEEKVVCESRERESGKKRPGRKEGSEGGGERERLRKEGKVVWV